MEAILLWTTLAQSRGFASRGSHNPVQVTRLCRSWTCEIWVTSWAHILTCSVASMEEQCARGVEKLRPWSSKMEREGFKGATCPLHCLGRVNLLAESLNRQCCWQQYASACRCEVVGVSQAWGLLTLGSCVYDVHICVYESRKV